MLQYLRREPGFYKRLASLAAPIILQNLVTTALGFADTFMVGLLGNAEMAAVTAANVPIFIIQLVIFGFQSGLSILVSQYWGRGDMENINRSMGVALYAITIFSTAMALATFFFPAQVLRLITPNEDLVQLGVSYIQIVGFSYIFNGISSVYVSVQRSAENPVFGMSLFATSMIVNTVLNYILIFGKFGAPQMGVTGAAVATLTSRVVELVVAVVYALRNRRTPLMPKYIALPGREMLGRFFKYSAPVVFNETLWGTGSSMLTVVMGHMANSQDMLAAYALMGNVDKLSTVMCFGVAASAAIIIGKEIGEGRDFSHVYEVARTVLMVAFMVGLCVMTLLLILRPTFFRPVLFPLFKLSPGAMEAANALSFFYALVIPMRAFNNSNITGILRAGGDSQAAFAIDVCPLWLVTIPLMALVALVLQAPVVLVCMAMQTENVVKAPIGFLRFRSRRWIHDITRAAS